MTSVASETGRAEAGEQPKLGRRIARLFVPYRIQLTGIMTMIVVTAVLSIISALLVRDVFNDALFARGGPTSARCTRWSPA